MDKFVSHRKSGKLLAAAVASVGLVSVANSAKAALVVDLRALNGTRSGGNHTVTAPSVGFTITMGVYAKLTGSDATTVVGDFDAEGTGDLLDRRVDEGLQIANGSFQSVGGLLGNMNSAAGALNYNSRTNPMGGPGSSNGVASDWDSDGDLDIGTNGTDPTNMWIIRSGSPTYATTFDSEPDQSTDTDNPQTAGGVQGKGWATIDDKGSSTGSGVNSEDTIISADNSELRVGLVKFIVTNLGNGAASFNFVRRPVDDSGAFLWYEDGAITGKFPGAGGGTLSTTGVSIVTAPEPTAIGLLGIASLGLLARRRNQKKA